MSAPELLVLGERLHALEPVPRVGEALGLSRGQSFRAAKSWPCTGGAGARRVIVPALLEELKIPYSVCNGTGMAPNEPDLAAGERVSAGQDDETSRAARETHFADALEAPAERP